MSAADRFSQKRDQGGRSAVDPPRQIDFVAPDDSTDLPFVTTAYRVGVSADLRVMMANGQIRTIPAAYLIAGVQYSGQLRRIYATGSGSHGTVMIEGPE